MGNPPGEAGLEITGGFLDAQFARDTVIAVTGTDMKPTLNGESLPMWQSVAVNRGATIKFGHIGEYGFRCYLGVAGGIEARVYAEDPDTYMPSPGTIHALYLPEGNTHLRIDHALRARAAVPPYYDPLLAKVITWGDGRDAAVDKLIEALEAIRIDGVKTTIPTCLKTLRNALFRTGDFDTSFLDNGVTPGVH